MKCPKCGGKLEETPNVTYSGKHSYYCIVCGYKGWLYKQDWIMELIDKDALVAEIKSRISDIKVTQKAGMIKKRDADKKILLFKSVLSLVDTLEVKEVDLDKEYTKEVYSHLDSIKDIVDRMTSGNFMHNRAAIKFSANTIAKVLELMGLQAQKGE